MPRMAPAEPRKREEKEKGPALQSIGITLPRVEPSTIPIQTKLLEFIL